MSRNFGLGSRDMGRAGQYALNNAAKSGEVGFSTAATNGDRWAQFATWVKGEGVNRMEHITSQHVQVYGQELADRVSAGELAASTAQNYVSAVNSVMSIATRGQWAAVSPVKACGIQQRDNVRSEPPGGLDRDRYQQAVQAVQDRLGDRAAAVVELVRELGLRSKEASLLDASRALREAARGAVTVDHGTKGGRVREIQIARPEQLQALQRAAAAQGDARAVMPAGDNWRSWREGGLRDTRETVQEVTGGGLHDLRSAYACERYEQLTGHAAPVAGGVIADRQADKEARELIASELGHGRIDVVSSYIGGR